MRIFYHPGSARIYKTDEEYIVRSTPASVGLLAYLPSGQEQYNPQAVDYLQTALKLYPYCIDATGVMNSLNQAQTNHQRGEDTA